MARESTKRGNKIWFVVHRSELMKQTYDTFERFGISLDGITIEMVQTIANHMDRYEKPDVIIFDEAHFSKAKTWQKIIEANPDAWYIGLTGSPCRLDGKPLGDIYQSMVVGITAKELIEMGMLSRYKYYAPTVASVAGLKKRGGEYSAEEAEKLLSTPAIFGDAIKHYNEFAKGKQAIVYCATIAHSEATAEAFRASGINAIHFDGNTPSKERKRIVEDFKIGKIDMLCNVDLISCGFDAPACECVIMLRPTMSLALFIQQSMRALRPKDGKEAVILDMVANYSRHGLPDSDREWSLTNTIKQKQAEQTSNSVRTCERCYFTFRSTQTVCPECGHINQRSREELKQIEQAKLQEITEAKRAKAIERVEGKKMDECRTLQDFQAWAKLNGKSSGWAYIMWKKASGWAKQKQKFKTKSG